MIGHPTNSSLHLFDVHRNNIITIAIDEYQYLPPLKHCVEESESLIKVLVEHFKGFEERWVTRLYNKNANKTKVLDTLNEKMCRFVRGDNLILYIAGHGFMDNDMYYFATHRTKGNYKNLCISFAEILKLIDRQDALHVLIIIDTCYAGKIHSLHRSFVTNDGVENPDFWQRVYVKKSIWALTAGAMEEVKAKSPFADAMIRALKSYGINRKNITINELRSLILRYFDSNIKQTPMIGYLRDVEGYENIGGEFVFLHKSPSILEPQIIKPSLPPKKEFLPVISPKPFSTNEDAVTREVKIDKEKPKSYKNLFRITSLILGLIIIVSTVIVNVDSRNLPPSGPDISIVSGPASPIIKESILVDTSKPKVPIYTKLAGGKKAKIYTDERQIRRNRKIEINKITSTDSLQKSNIVFVGSFENKENAIRILNRLKSIGYQNAEIIMKENLPYMVVVSDFYLYKKRAKNEVETLNRQGIEAYHAKIESDAIFRSKAN